MGRFCLFLALVVDVVDDAVNMVVDDVLDMTVDDHVDIDVDVGDMVDGVVAMVAGDIAVAAKIVEVAVVDLDDDEYMIGLVPFVGFDENFVTNGVAMEVAVAVADAVENIVAEVTACEMVSEAADSIADFEMASKEDEAFDYEMPPPAAVAAEYDAEDSDVAEWELMQKAESEMGKKGDFPWRLEVAPEVWEVMVQIFDYFGNIDLIFEELDEVDALEVWEVVEKVALSEYLAHAGDDGTDDVNFVR